MRWLTGWSGGAFRSRAPVYAAPSAVRPLAASALWAGPNPLWAVGDWRPDEIRLATLRPGSATTVSSGLAGPETTDADTPATLRLAVVGRCGASDAELAAGLAAARGGAVRHLTRWPGSYTAVLRIGTRSTLLLTDLAGAQPVFHAPWYDGTVFATAALPLADLVGAAIDIGHLAARLACPESPEALGTGTPYVGVRRVPPGHTLAIRGGRADTAPYDDDRTIRPEEAPAVRELTRALLESVRSRVRALPHPPGGGISKAPADVDRPPLGADLSYGTASATVALLAAAVPIGAGSGRESAVPLPAPRTGAVRGSWVRDAAQPAEPEPLAAVTAGDLAGAALAVDVPRLRHIVLPPTLPYAELADDPLAGPLTDEPGPALVTVAHTADRFSAGGADHLTGYGARQVLDGHPARLADLILAGRSRELLAPLAALAGADRALAGALAGTVRTPVRVVRAAHRLARSRYADGLHELAAKLTARHTPLPDTAGASSAAELAWCVAGPAARLLSDEALSAVALRLRLAGRGLGPSERPGARRARLALHRHAAEYRILVQAAEQHGQRLHAPFLDNQVVRAAWLLPDDVRLQPGARHALLRAVLLGAGRADLPPDWGRAPRPDRIDAERTGLRLAAAALTELFRQPILHEAGLIDLSAVRQTLARALDAEATLPPGTLAGLADLVSTELWLRRIRARRHGSCWTGLPPIERMALTASR